MIGEQSGLVFARNQLYQRQAKPVPFPALGSLGMALAQVLQLPECKPGALVVHRQHASLWQDLQRQRHHTAGRPVAQRIPPQVKQGTLQQARVAVHQGNVSHALAPDLCTAALRVFPEVVGALVQQLHQIDLGETGRVK